MALKKKAKVKTTSENKYELEFILAGDTKGTHKYVAARDGEAIDVKSERIAFGSNVNYLVKDKMKELGMKDAPESVTVTVTW